MENLILLQNGKFRREVGTKLCKCMLLCYVCLPGSLIIIVSGYLELILDELGLKRVELIV